jgi:hypothetical protein
MAQHVASQPSSSPEEAAKSETRKRRGRPPGSKDRVSRKEVLQRRYGPPKEKGQVTVRLDEELLKKAKEQFQKTNSRITDMIERGLWLAMKEQDQELPMLTNRVRFLVANASKPQQERIEKFMTFLVLDEVEKLSPLEAVMREAFMSYLDLMHQKPDRQSRAAAVYSHYGRTSEEASKIKAGS